MALGSLLLPLAACSSPASVPEAGEVALASDDDSALSQHCVPGVGRQAAFAARSKVMLNLSELGDAATGGWESAQGQRYAYRIHQLEGGYSLPASHIQIQLQERAGKTYTCAREE